jgi:hypothetical protein
MRRKISAHVEGGRASADGERGPPLARAEVIHIILQMLQLKVSKEMCDVSDNIRFVKME